MSSLDSDAFTDGGRVNTDKQLDVKILSVSDRILPIWLKLLLHTIQPVIYTEGGSVSKSTR